VPPPEVASRDASPVQIRIEQLHERIELARSGCVKGGLDLRWSDRHAATLALASLAALLRAAGDAKAELSSDLALPRVECDERERGSRQHARQIAPKLDDGVSSGRQFLVAPE